MSVASIVDVVISEKNKLMKPKLNWWEIEYTCKVRDKETGARCDSENSSTNNCSGRVHSRVGLAGALAADQVGVLGKDGIGDLPKQHGASVVRAMATLAAWPFMPKPS